MGDWFVVPAAYALKQASERTGGADDAPVALSFLPIGVGDLSWDGMDTGDIVSEESECI